ncbi:MAG: LLM class flavin-dependent oxidoreductase, partial [Candidatus Binatia bacterium]
MKTRFALSLPLPPDVPHCLSIAERAAALGYESVWLADGSGVPDPFVLSAALAARVPSMRIGIGVAPAYTRTPAAFAALAGALGQLMPG